MKINKDDYVNMPVGFHSVILSTLDETQGAVIENGFNGKRIVITAVAAALVITASVGVALKMNKSGLINKATEDLSLNENGLDNTSEVQENETTQTTTLLSSTTQTAETTTQRIEQTEPYSMSTTQRAKNDSNNSPQNSFGDSADGYFVDSPQPQTNPYQEQYPKDTYFTTLTPEMENDIKRAYFEWMKQNYVNTEPLTEYDESKIRINHDFPVTRKYEHCYAVSLENDYYEYEWAGTSNVKIADFYFYDRYFGSVGGFNIEGLIYKDGCLYKYKEAYENGFLSYHELGDLCVNGGYGTGIDD